MQKSTPHPEHTQPAPELPERLNSPELIAFLQIIYSFAKQFVAWYDAHVKKGHDEQH